MNKTTFKTTVTRAALAGITAAALATGGMGLVATAAHAGGGSQAPDLSIKFSGESNGYEKLTIHNYGGTGSGFFMYAVQDAQSNTVLQKSVQNLASGATITDQVSLNGLPCGQLLAVLEDVTFEDTTTTDKSDTAWICPQGHLQIKLTDTELHSVKFTVKNIGDENSGPVTVHVIGNKGTDFDLHGADLAAGSSKSFTATGLHAGERITLMAVGDTNTIMGEATVTLPVLIDPTTPICHDNGDGTVSCAE